MNNFQSKVAEFHKAFGVPIHDTPQVAIGKDRALLRATRRVQEGYNPQERMELPEFIRE